MRVADIYCGEGGAGKGYARAGADEVVGVDNSVARLKLYPFETLKSDGIAFILEHGHEFDLIHASPPCTGYTQGTSAIPDRLAKYDRLIAATRVALELIGKPYVIENVTSKETRAELRDPLMLCWTEFNRPGSVVDEDGTPLWMRRHRLFESNVPLWSAGGCQHPKNMQCAGAYGGARRDKVEARTIRRGGYVPSVAVMRELLGTPWMSEKGCQLSIPPSYTEHIGRQLLAHIESERAA